MALTRKFLQAMGIDDDKIDEIISAHASTVNGLKEEIDKYKADSEKLPKVAKELEEAKTAMANGDKSPYKVKYDALKEEKDALEKKFEEYKTGVEAEAVKAKKAEAYKTLLKETGVAEKRIDAILKITDVDSLELGGDGKLKTEKELAESIKSEWADFIVKSSEQGASVATPPANNAGSSAKTRDEIMKISDTQERQKAWAEFLDNERRK